MAADRLAQALHASIASTNGTRSNSSQGGNGGRHPNRAPSPADPWTGARRARITAEAWTLAAHEPDFDTDADHLARLVEFVGDVAHAYTHGHSDIADELVRVAACCLARVDRDVARRSDPNA